MRRITFTCLMMFCITTFAQQGINYKALIKDDLGNIIADDDISVQFILFDGIANVYEELQTPSTDSNGIIILNIGEGIPIGGSDFSTIDWSSNNHFLNVKINTGNGLQDMGTTAFKMVPYALHAKTAGNVRIVDGTEGAGKVLTDVTGDGNATWQAQAIQNINGTTNFVPKSINGLALGDSQIFDDGTSIGINTTNPSERLHIQDNSPTKLLLKTSSGTSFFSADSPSNSGLLFRTSGVDNAFLYYSPFSNSLTASIGSNGWTMFSDGAIRVKERIYSLNDLRFDATESITIEANGALIKIDPLGNIQIQGKSVTITAEEDLALTANNISIDAQSTLLLNATTITSQASGNMNLDGSLIKFNGGTTPFARVGDFISNLQIVTGSSNVLGN